MLVVAQPRRTAPSLAHTQVGKCAGKVVEVLMSQPPGGDFDFAGCLAADCPGKQKERSFIAKRKLGSGTRIGTDFMVKSAPDGRTLLASAVCERDGDLRLARCLKRTSGFTRRDKLQP